MKRHLIVYLIASGLLAAAAGLSQQGSRGYVSTGIAYQRWSVEHVDDPVQQTSVPIAAFFPFSKQLTIHFSNLPASTSFGSSKLSGLSDTWIKATYLFSGEKFMMHFGVGAPTGKTKLDASEFLISQILSENLFQFRLPVYGQGFSAKIGAALAVPLNETAVLGFGLNMITKKAYHPISDDQIEFQPGGETSIFTGLDYKVGFKSKWTFDVVYTMYGKDKINGEEVHAAGSKLLVHSQLTAALGQGMLNASVYFRQRGKNEYWTGTVLEKETKNSNGNQLEMDVDWQLYKWQTGTLSLIGAGRFYSNNEYDEGKASVLGIGIGTAFRLSTNTSVSFAVKTLSGTLKSMEENLKVKGIDVMGGFVFEL